MLVVGIEADVSKLAVRLVEGEVTIAFFPVIVTHDGT